MQAPLGLTFVRWSYPPRVAATANCGPVSDCTGASDLDAVLLGVALELGADAALGGADGPGSQRCSSPASRLRTIDLTGPTEAGAMEMER